MKNEWILWVVGGVVALAAIGYTVLIPATDRKMMFTKITNPNQWNQFKMECRKECGSRGLACVAPCMEDAVMTGYTT